MATDYSKSLNLPATEFAMRANLPQREPAMLSAWENDELYQTLMEKNADKPTFILHDGPPYANGDIHIGHALNKILKDFIVRYRNMSGFRSPYVPGWDCHGLPAESAIIKQHKLDHRNMSVSEFRNKCKDFVLSYVDIQREGFKRLGVVGDWDRPYLTLAPEFEARQIEVFGEMAKKGYIYKGLKPVYWCAHDETALAEAEIEYNDDPCDSIYVKFAVDTDPNGALKSIEGLPAKVYFVIWTTTTWTLPGNLGICLNADFEYDLVKVGDEAYVIAKELLPEVAKAVNLPEHEILGTVKGSELEGMTARHPFLDRPSYVICGEHVTLDGGTGCVHTAPGFGAEDFDIWNKYKDLPKLIVPVDGKGRLTDEAGEKYSGLTTAEANVAILADLKESGALLGVVRILHQYPHCWRCKNPIIYRATEQWFASVKELTEQAVKACDEIEWIPAWGKDRMVAMIRERNDWCISRQRKWGVPIPILYCDGCGKYVVNEHTISKISALFREKGSNAWYDMYASEIVPGLKCEECGGMNFSKEKDIMDVWFDSGSSHAGVLDERDDLTSPADIYLEGGDQYRGWFQSSMLTSIAAKGVAPFKRIITHGWTVDGEGKAMHKSLGNAVSPKEVIDTYGADILRLWVASVEYTVDARISKDILKQLSEVYRKIRNTARILMGNLGSAENDFDPARDMVDESKLPDIDKWALARLNKLTKTVNEAYASYRFHDAYHAVSNFCTIEMSKMYIDIAKDRTYASAKDGFGRRCAQTVMYKILSALTRLISPILVFTSDEIWKSMAHTEADDARNVLLNDMPVYDASEPFAAEEARYEKLFELRDAVLSALEVARAGKLIGKSLEAKVVITAEGETYEFLSGFDRDELSDVFIVSGTEVREGAVAADEVITVSVSEADGEKCARCWKHSSSATEVDGEYICPRCKQILGI